MTQSSTTASKRRCLFKKLPCWVTIIGLLFVAGSIVAQDEDKVENADGVVENEVATTDKSKGEEQTKSVESETDDKSASAVSDHEEADNRTDNTAVKKVKIRIHAPTIAKETVKKKNPETGSHLPNGDPTANVVRITGEGIREFFRRHEYLRRR